MPELPEVETIVQGLKPLLLGRSFRQVKIYDEHILYNIEPEIFCNRVAGKQITDLERRGKYIIFKFLYGETMLLHLRMTGALLWNPLENEPYTRLEFFTDDGGHLVYSDVRRLGRIYLTDHPRELLEKLGVEPLSDNFTAARLIELMKRRSTPIKAVLLNQKLIAGIGNMYADEALFKARIHPMQPASSLDCNEIKSLHRAIREVLKKGIKNNGASVRNYRRTNGEPGRAHLEFAVAHRRGNCCPRCGTPIIRIVVHQRGTYFCPHCQTKK
jgi:formamidopyrimidine-DNA glycosylase